MKNLLCSIFLIAFSFSTVIAQEGVSELKSKMDVFSSTTGSIVKFADYNLRTLGSSYGVAESRIRKVTVGGNTQLFLQISMEAKYDTKTASIAYEDVLEILRAFPELKLNAQKDISTEADYIENKFVTDDGFQVGYYVSKGKIRWYLVLEKYGSDNTFFLEDVISAESLFNQAKNKMAEMNL